MNTNDLFASPDRPVQTMPPRKQPRLHPPEPQNLHPPRRNPSSTRPNDLRWMRVHKLIYHSPAVLARLHRRLVQPVPQGGWGRRWLGWAVGGRDRGRAPRSTEMAPARAGGKDDGPGVLGLDEVVRRCIVEEACTQA